MEETTPTEPEKEETLLSWKASEYTDYERNWKWYLGLGLILLAVIGYSIYAQDWFIIIISIILTGILFWYTKQKPNEKEYKISQLGIYVGETLYPYNEIHSFWLLLKPNFHQLNIMFNKKYLPLLSILIPDDVDPIVVKTTIGRFLPEQDNRSESIIDYLTRLFKI